MSDAEQDKADTYPVLDCSASDRLRAINADRSLALGLRVEVLGGGCSGFQYRFSLTEDIDDHDVIVHTVDAEGTRQWMAIDPESLPFLEHARVVFRDELIGARFEVENPNASSGCGCGLSFSI